MGADKNRAIRKKVYFAFEMELASPLNLSSGNSVHTDSDVLCNGLGEYFIPGTSIAGALKNGLGLKEKEAGIMGFSDGEKGQMSGLYISDLYLNGAKVSVRDGIALNDEKQVEDGKKFDLEIIETGATGTMYLKYILRDGEEQAHFENSVRTIIQKIESGDIRFGANKNRGMGRLKLILPVAYRAEFSKENRDAYLSFIKNSKELDNYDRLETEQFDVWLNAVQADKAYVKIQVPLQLNGGISIRKYSAKKNQPDYSHITCNDQPVIPGSSFNGAIRKDALRILKDAGCDNAENLITRWFGYVESNKPTDEDAVKAQQSMVVIAESVIEGAVGMPVTRNKVNRFTSGTVDNALYTDYSYFGGTTQLEILVKKDEEREYKALVGLLHLVVEDITKGFVSIGGLASIGRGLLELPDGGSIMVQNGEDKAVYTKALYEFVKGGAGK